MSSQDRVDPFQIRQESGLGGRWPLRWRPGTSVEGGTWFWPSGFRVYPFWPLLKKNTFPIPAPGWLPTFPAIQGNTIILVYSNEPWHKKYGKLMKTRFHEVEHESKMQLHKTHSHTSERRGCEADKKRNKKGQDRKPIRKGQGNC